MNLGTIMVNVTSITGRPDKTAEIRMAINRAVRRFSAGGHFAQDLSEESVVVDTGSGVYAGQFAISMNLTRFRAMLAMKPMDTNYYLTPVAPDKVFSQDCERLDTYYIAGDSVVFKCSRAVKELKCSYFQYPASLSNPGDTNWIMQQYPDTIVYFASSDIFSGIGNKEEAARVRALGYESYNAALAQQQGVSAHGFSV